MKYIMFILCLCCMVCPSALATDTFLVWEPSPIRLEMPYTHYYEDEHLCIAINRYDVDGIVYHLCDVQIAFPAVMRSALSYDKPNANHERLMDIAKRHEAVLAINADNYGYHRNGIIIRNGTLIRSKPTTRDLLIVDKNGDLSIETNHKEEDLTELANLYRYQNVQQVFAFGPALIDNYEILPIHPKFKLISTKDSRREPRTAIGQFEPLHYLLLIADGRREGHSKGMTFPEMRAIFLQYKVKTAFNLDGGGSTQLYFNGETINRLAGGQRGMTDILYFK